MINNNNQHSTLNCLTDDFFDKKLDKRHLNYLNEMKQKMNAYINANENDKQRKRKNLFKYAMKHKKTFLKLCQLGDIPFDIIEEFIFSGRAATWSVLGSVIPNIDTFTNEIIDNKLVLVKYYKDGQMYGMYASPNNSEQIKKCLQNVEKISYNNEPKEKKIVIKPNAQSCYLTTKRDCSYGEIFPCSIAIFPMNYSTSNCQAFCACDGDTAAINQSETINNILSNVDNNINDKFSLLFDACSKATIYNNYLLNELNQRVINKISTINMLMLNIPTNFGKAKIDKIMNLFKNKRFEKIDVRVVVYNTNNVFSPIHSPLGGWRLKKRFESEQQNIPSNKSLVYVKEEQEKNTRLYEGRKSLTNTNEINNGVNTFLIRRQNNNHNI